MQPHRGWGWGESPCWNRPRAQPLRQKGPHQEGWGQGPQQEAPGGSWGELRPRPGLAGQELQGPELCWGRPSCYGQKLSPQIWTLEPRSPVPQSVTLFGHRPFKT